MTKVKRKTVLTLSPALGTIPEPQVVQRLHLSQPQAVEGVASCAECSWRSGHSVPTVTCWKACLSPPLSLACSRPRELADMGMSIYLHKHMSTVLSKTTHSSYHTMKEKLILDSLQHSSHSSLLLGMDLAHSHLRK